MSKMKVLNVLVITALVMSFVFSGSTPAATAVPLSGQTETTIGGSTPRVPSAVTAIFPVLDDFETGLPPDNGGATPPNGWIPYTGNGSVINTAAISSSLPGQTINTAAAITYTITNG
ncbi:MAG TPA: hypothetical protein VMP08_11510, partial [Anaerolineae bacterium]|nr:hypothetical protein [Anaerolineae bacterium]